MALTGSAERPPVLLCGPVDVLALSSAEDVLETQLGFDRRVAAGKLLKMLPGLVHGPVMPIAGMAEQDIMTLHGWSTTRMLSRYGAAAAEQRATASSRALALGNQL